MTEILVLDSGPVGDLSGDPSHARVIAAWTRLASALSRGDVILPEIVDYEVRREIQRRQAFRSLIRLDRLKSRFVYDPLTTEIMRKAAEFWGYLRREGRPTADPHALDADVILAAPAALLVGPGDRVAVVTTNSKHLGRLVETRDWASLA